MKILITIVMFALLIGSAFAMSVGTLTNTQPVSTDDNVEVEKVFPEVINHDYNGRSSKKDGKNLPTDLNNDGKVDMLDIDLIINNWGDCKLNGQTKCYDTDGDNSAGFSDILNILGDWTQDEVPDIKTPVGIAVAQTESGGHGGSTSRKVYTYAQCKTDLWEEMKPRVLNSRLYTVEEFVDPLTDWRYSLCSGDLWSVLRGFFFPETN